MLSNVELIVLSLVQEKPSYAYEIEKQIEARNMRLWVKVGIASIYQVLERLHRKGYVEFQVEREGKAPERKRYFTTAIGREELKISVKELLVKLEWFYLDLNVAIEGSDILEAEEYKKCLIERLEKVSHSLHKLREDYYGEEKKSKKAQIVMRSVMLMREAEEKLLLELIDEHE